MNKGKQLMYRCGNGHVCILRFRPADGPEGTDEALQSWLNNPDIPFTQTDFDKLKTVLGCVFAAYGP